VNEMNEALTDIQNLCIAKNLPFVTFRLPQQESCTTFIQTSKDDSRWDSIKEIPGENGFIMAPFDTGNGHPYMVVRPDLVLEGRTAGKVEMDAVRALEGRRAPDWSGNYPVVIGRDPYMEQVNAIKSTIANGAFQKAVLSRIRVISGNYLSIISRLFRSLCLTHPNAFVYLFKNGNQFWMGASPEPLLRLKEGRISTVSLAGTRPYAEEHMDVNRWTAKEVLEQEYVTRYIHDVLHSFGIRDYRVSSPYVKKAGNLLHLRTDFSLAFEKVNGQLWELVDALHPTPAVAGQPKDDAVRFIKQLEPHDREYYTGFLGPVNGHRELDLFVNLRCLKITPGYLALYVGGGITLDSDPSDEWDETRLKVESLLEILRNYIQNLEPADAARSTYS
jgi:isochorismate synthase